MKNKKKKKKKKINQYFFKWYIQNKIKICKKKLLMKLQIIL